MDIHAHAGAVINIAASTDQRIDWADGYDDGGLPVKTNQDERDQKLFKQGWDSAIHESQLWYVQGKIEEFWNTLGGPSGPVAEHPDPMDTLGGILKHARSVQVSHDVATEDDTLLAEYQASHSDEPYSATPLYIKVEGPGEDPEPLVEQEPVGMWTLSQDELNSRLEEAEARGWDSGFQRGRTTIGWTPEATVIGQTTERALRIIAGELNQFLWPDGYKDLTKGDVLGTFAIHLARRLGWAVSE